MFRQVFIIQCVSTGEFLTHGMFMTKNLNKAGYMLNKQAAVDTGFNEFDTDFAVYDFYKKESELPAYCFGVSGNARPPQ